MTSIKVKKTKPASKVYGGGYRYFPAQYEVLRDGIKVAAIVGTARGFRGGTLWMVVDTDGRELFSKLRFKTVKDWAINHYEGENDGLSQL